jgi:hypothetical protein
MKHYFRSFFWQAALVFFCISLINVKASGGGIVSERFFFLPLQAEQCVVDVEEGTNLNVRSKPDGKIIAKLPRDTVVRLGRIARGSGDYSWAQVSVKRGGRWRVLGWASTEFLLCQ